MSEVQWNRLGRKVAVIGYGSQRHAHALSLRDSGVDVRGLLRRRAKKNRVGLHFTPTLAAWANSIEARFGPLRQFTIANSYYPNHMVQTRAPHISLRWPGANARRGDVLAAQLEERARIRGEKGVRWGGRPLASAA